MISAEPLPSPAQLARIGRGGVGTLRVNLAWGVVQGARGAPYDWSHYDGVVGAAARSGIRVLATVYSSPTWAEPTPEHPPLGAMLPRFEAFVRAAVKRYGSDGSFWRQHPELPRLPITDWQAWNEPNSPLFWKPAPDASAYLELLRGFHTAVKSVDPQARVMLGGPFPTPTGGIPMTDFMSRLYRGGGRGLFDVAAIHPYAATPDQALAGVAELRRIMDSSGNPHTPIWITEVGWASGGAPSGLTVGPQRQADYLRRTFELAAAARDRLGIAGVVWYSLNDTPGPLWPGHCGLFTLEGSPKPSWSAYTELTGGTP